MVSPFYLLAVGLGLGFLLGLTGKKLQNITAVMVMLAFAFFTYFSFTWISAFFSGELKDVLIYSAGFQPPFSISLSIGYHEAIISLLINIRGLLSVIYLWKRINSDSSTLGGVLMILFMSLNMIVFARDIFNIFVWLEITAIATSGLILLDKDNNSHSAGFKYLLATSLISSIYLLGVVLIYFTTGTLFLNDLAGAEFVTTPMAMAAVFMMLMPVVLELKPFPANGWALDVYEGANPAIGAIISGGVATAMLFLLNKFLVVANTQIFTMLTIIGALTFLFSNWMGLMQKNPNRLFGYSCIGLIGLVMAIM